MKSINKKERCESDVQRLVESFSVNSHDRRWMPQINLYMYRPVHNIYLYTHNINHRFRRGNTPSKNWNVHEY